MKRLSTASYESGWRPDVRVTPKKVRVYVVKRAVPKSIRTSSSDEAPPQLFMGELSPNDDGFDDKLTELVAKAQERASTLSVAQDSSNEYNQRLAVVVSSRRWKWVFGGGILVGMALPNIPHIPFI